MDSSEFLHFLESRSSVRSYSGKPLRGEDFSYILDCAVSAPSAGNLEAWDVVVITSQETRSDLSAAAFDQRHVEEAPVLFCVCANYVRSMSRYGERGILYAIQDATIACTFMMLAAHASGLHSCWTGAFDEEAVREILALPPHIRPVAILAIGRGAPPGEQTPRMAASEHVHWNQW